MSENTEIIRRAIDKLHNEYTNVFQSTEYDAQERRFEWKAFGKSVIEDSSVSANDRTRDEFGDPIAFFESHIDSRFTAMMWRVMPIVSSILPQALASAESEDEAGRIPHGPAVEMAKAILGDDL